MKRFLAQLLKLDVIISDGLYASLKIPKNSLKSQSHYTLTFETT